MIKKKVAIENEATKILDNVGIIEKTMYHQEPILTINGIRNKRFYSKQELNEENNQHFISRTSSQLTLDLSAASNQKTRDGLTEAKRVEIFELLQQAFELQKQSEPNCRLSSIKTMICRPLYEEDTLVKNLVGGNTKNLAINFIGQRVLTWFESAMQAVNNGEVTPFNYANSKRLNDFKSDLFKLIVKQTGRLLGVFRIEGVNNKPCTLDNTLFEQSIKHLQTAIRLNQEKTLDSQNEEYKTIVMFLNDLFYQSSFKSQFKC